MRQNWKSEKQVIAAVTSNLRVITIMGVPEKEVLNAGTKANIDQEMMTAKNQLESTWRNSVSNIPDKVCP